MLRIPSPDSVRAIGRFLLSSGYDIDHLGPVLGLSDTLHANFDNLQALLCKTEGDSPLHVLARLFFVGWPVEIETCRRVIPDEVLANCLEAGLLIRTGSHFECLATLVSFENLLIACDAARHRGNNPDRVVGPSLTTRLISRLTVRGNAEVTLDLGTGGGVLAFEAATYSKQVVGTDVNERALEFAAFNAALNGISNVSFACGDAFAPVKGQRFSRIIANPPFFITPAKRFTYSDSPLELDGFSRRLAVEAPSYLEEGGFFQMISEWVQVAGQSWEQRIRGWVKGSDCDVLVLRCLELTPIQYVETRLREAELLHATESENLFATHLAYLKERNVESIVGGIVTMRKRHGGNWFSTVIGEPASYQLGKAVRERFETITFAATHAPEALLKRKFHLASDTVLQQRTAPRATGWETISSELVKTAGFKDCLGLDSVVSNFVHLFNGQRTLTEVAKLVSESLQVSQLDAEKQCLRLAQRLLESSFIEPA